MNWQRTTAISFIIIAYVVFIGSALFMASRVILNGEFSLFGIGGLFVAFALYQIGSALRRRPLQGVNAALPEEIKSIQWLEPWEPVPEGAKLRREKGIVGYDLELVREVGPKHPLFQHKSEAVLVGARRDCDDRLYWIPDPARPYVVVHLTWAGIREQRNADYPTTVFYASLDDWTERCMKQHHLGWTS